MLPVVITHTGSLTHIHCNYGKYMYTHSHSLSLSHTHTHTLSLCLSVSLSLSHTHTHTYTHISDTEQRAPVDRRLLIISNQDGGVVGRLPGQLNGRQFKVYDCKQCTILVLDHTSTITVDNCTGCQIFIAPSKGR